MVRLIITFKKRTTLKKIQKVINNLISLGLSFNYTNKNKEIEIFFNNDNEISIIKIQEVIEDGQLQVRYSSYNILKAFIERLMIEE